MEHPIFDTIEKAEKPDFADVLTESFDAIKGLWQPALYHGLINMLIVLPMLLVVYIPLFPMYLGIFENLGNPYYQPDVDYSVPMIIGYIVVVMVLSLITSIFSFALVAHFYKTIRLKDMGNEVSPGGYFSYLKGNFGKIFVLNLAAMGISLVAVLLCYLPLFYVMVPLQLFAVMFTFNQDLTVSQIIKASFKLGHKFWLIIFGIVMIASMIAQLGIVVCFIGMFVTQLFVHIPVYNIYKKTIGFAEDTTM